MAERGFYSTSNGDLSALENWWADWECTIPATSLPSVNDDVILFSRPTSGVCIGLRIFGQVAIDGGTFNSPIECYEDINGGTFNASVAAGSIYGGTFNSTVSGGGTIWNGEFMAAVNWYGSICGGNFYADVYSTGEVYDGSFYANVSNSDGLLGGMFFGDAIAYSSLRGGYYFNTLALYGVGFSTQARIIGSDGTTLYAPAHPAVAPASAVKAGVSNLGVAGTYSPAARLTAVGPGVRW